MAPPLHQFGTSGGVGGWDTDLHIGLRHQQRHWCQGPRHIGAFVREGGEPRRQHMAVNSCNCENWTTALLWRTAIVHQGNAGAIPWPRAMKCMGIKLHSS